MSPVLAAAPTALLGGAADRQALLGAADAALRAPLAVCRRIGFVQLAGGAGASATAAAVATLVARRRGDGVLAVDAASGPRSLGWHLGLGDARGTDPEARRRRPASRADALAGLPRTASGLAVLDVHGPETDLAVGDAAWAAQVAPLARFLQAVVTDFGVRGAAADLGAAAAASTVVCIVARADRPAVERALDAALAVRALPHRPLAVVAAVDVGRTATAAAFGARTPVPVVRVPFEPARGRGRPVAGRACRAATRTAVIRLGAALMAQPAPVRIPT